MKYPLNRKQDGISLVGLMFILAIVAVLAVLAMKVVPAFVEYNGIQRAIVSAKAAGITVREIQGAFDKQAEVGYITSINGKDLEITKNGEEVVVTFAYQKKIPLVGPASLLLEFTGSTASQAPKKPGV